MSLVFFLVDGMKLQWSIAHAVVPAVDFHQIEAGFGENTACQPQDYTMNRQPISEVELGGMRPNDGFHLIVFAI